MHLSGGDSPPRPGPEGGVKACITVFIHALPLSGRRRRAGRNRPCPPAPVAADRCPPVPLSLGRSHSPSWSFTLTQSSLPVPPKWEGLSKKYRLSGRNDVTGSPPGDATVPAAGSIAAETPAPVRKRDRGAGTAFTGVPCFRSARPWLDQGNDGRRHSIVIGVRLRTHNQKGTVAARQGMGGFPPGRAAKMAAMRAGGLHSWSTIPPRTHETMDITRL